MQELLSALVLWLSTNADLPASFEHPRIERVSGARMVEVRRERVGASMPGPAVHALYDDVSRTIYLGEDWSADSPAHLSILVHELAHHLQNVAGARYPCAAAREKPAYRAQARWLEQLDTDLSREFGIDAMTLLLRTGCLPP